MLIKNNIYIIKQTKNVFHENNSITNDLNVANFGLRTVELQLTAHCDHTTIMARIYSRGCAA